MASQMTYIHVAINLNFTSIYTQGEILRHHLQNLANLTTPHKHKIPFTKAARDTGKWALKKLDRTITKLQNIDYILPHNDTIEARQEQLQFQTRHRRDIACLYGYSSTPKLCDDVGDIAAFFINPLGAIITAAKGERYQDSNERYYADNRRSELELGQIENQINHLYNKTQHPAFPQTYWNVYSSERPPTETTTYPFYNGYNGYGESRWWGYKKYLSAKRYKLQEVLKQLQEEDEQFRQDFRDFDGQLPDFYLHSRHKRFLQAFSLFSDIVGTFMGAFNAYEIQQLKEKFTELSTGHNMLVRITSQNTNEIRQISNGMKQIMDTLEYMAKYNPAEIMMQLDEHLDVFRDRVTVLSNAVQQLHHRRLSIDLLSPEQMDVMHKAVHDEAAVMGFTPLTTKVVDYFQIEVTYMRSGKDIILIVHVPCTKTAELLTIHRYLPFPIPLPILPKAHDMTIAQSLSISKFTEKSLDQLFDQNDLDYKQAPEALFISSDSDLIAIGKDNNYQILSPTQLAGCVQKNHIYICDKHHVTKNDLSESCLGSLFLRIESGVRTYCKFERKPVQELVYQLSPTDHLIFSPIPQSPVITCMNGSNERIDIGRTTRVHLEAGCTVKTRKHTIVSDNLHKIAPTPLQMTWSWDPFELPSTMLLDAQHLDHMLYETQKYIYNLHSNITNSTTTQKQFDNLMVKSKFSFSYFPILIWLALAISSTALLILFFIAFYNYYSNRKTQQQQYQQQHNFQQTPQIPMPINNLIQDLLQNRPIPVNMNQRLAII